MKRRSYKGLIALNVIFITALLIVSLAPEADGQQRVRRPRGDYTMVAGQVQGFTEDAIYIVDAANQELLALRWNRSDRRLSAVGYRDLRADTQGQNQQGR